MKILLTSGGTRVPIDDVRHIGNMSSGTFGAKICREMADLMGSDDELIFLHAKGSKKPFEARINLADGRSMDIDDRLQEDLAAIDYILLNFLGDYREVEYSNFDDYAEKLRNILAENPPPDVVALVAAVSDFKVKGDWSGKISSTEDTVIELIRAPKLISEVKDRCPRCKLVGFKLLVDSTDDELIAAARKSITDNGCNLVVANDLRDIKAGKQRIILVTDDEVTEYRASKRQSLAEIVAGRCVKLGDD